VAAIPVVDPARDHIRGAPGGDVTLIEYGDFQCPYCGDAYPVVKALLKRFDWLRFAFRHMPLPDLHPRAPAAAEAAEAAAAQGAFWEMHDALLDHQDDLRPMALGHHAEGLGLDMERFWDDLRKRVQAPRIAEDVASADASGVSGTPSFFINGRRYQGAYDIDTLTNVVRAAGRRVRAAAAA
jgi:protein-disulfide isomerase